MSADPSSLSAEKDDAVSASSNPLRLPARISIVMIRPAEKAGYIPAHTSKTVHAYPGYGAQPPIGPSRLSLPRERDRGVDMTLTINDSAAHLHCASKLLLQHVLQIDFVLVFSRGGMGDGGV